MKYNLGVLIKNNRMEKKLSKEELAELVGVNKTTITKWEKNISKPSFSSLLMLTKVLNVNFDELILGYEINKSNKKEAEEEIKKLLVKNTKYKSIFNVVSAIFVCLCKCLIEVSLFKYHMVRKDFNFIFLLLIFVICFSAFTESLEKANLFEEKNKYKEYGILLIIAFILAISGFVICFA